MRRANILRDGRGSNSSAPDVNSESRVKWMNVARVVSGVAAGVILYLMLKWEWSED